MTSEPDRAIQVLTERVARLRRAGWGPRYFRRYTLTSMSSKHFLFLFVLLPLISCAAHKVTILPQEEPYISNIRQLTFGGENAEGYFSFDEKKFSYQRTHPDAGDHCDQIYMYDLASGREKRISTGYGRTTCSYFLP